MQLIEKLTKIADAIRGKTGSTEKMTLDQMEKAIQGIESGSEPMVLHIRVIDHTGWFNTDPLVLRHAGLGFDVTSLDTAPIGLGKAEKLSTIVNGLGIINMKGLAGKSVAEISQLRFFWQYSQEDMSLLIEAMI